MLRPERPRCEIWRLGRVPLPQALALQAQLVRERAAEDAAPERLLLLEHPPVFTLGSAARAEHLLWDVAERRRHGVALQQVDRGGAVTWHGPGQLVGWPVLRLARRGTRPRLDVAGHLRRLETTLIRALADFGILGETHAGRTGVWASTARGAVKLAAIGLRVNTRGVTSHGFALNIDVDLAWYAGIVPCGIREYGVGSMRAVLGAAPDATEVSTRLAMHFSAVFGYEMAAGEPASIRAAMRAAASVNG